MSLALVTGFPRLLSSGLVIRALNLDPEMRVALLVAPDDQTAAERFIADLDHADRIELLLGRPSATDLGLTGSQLNRILPELTYVFHTAMHTQGSRAVLRHKNVDTLHRILEFAQEAPNLKRFLFVSTAFVSGNRSGMILEEELDCGQAFRTPFEYSMFVAESLAREMMPRLPITILRPASMIGHSRTGESHGLTEGPNYLVRLMVRLPAEIPLLLPGKGVVPFNIVPIDYVVRASWAIAAAPEAVSRTFHLTDPNPVSARKAFELLSDLANRPAPFTGGLPFHLLRRGLKMAGLGRIAPHQMALFENLTLPVTYSCAGALELLARTDIVCPPFESYADALVTWISAYERSANHARIDESGQNPGRL